MLSLNILHGNYSDHSEGCIYGNWWLAASSCQRAHSCITSHAEFFWWNIKSPRWLSPPYNPDLAPSDFWLSPKLKPPLKGKRFHTVKEIQENTVVPLMETGRTVRLQGAYFEGDWGIAILCTVVLVSCIFFNKCLYFSYYMAEYFLDRPHISWVHKLIFI